jgi:hypothetical protein
MKETKRALRRHHQARRLRRAIRMYGPGREDWARRTFENMQKCSCCLCGHRRRWYGPTFQERRFDAGARVDTMEERFW